MKLKTVKIVVELQSDLNERWTKALRGKIKRSSSQEIISVGSWEILGKIFSASRLQLLAVILTKKPKSI